MKGFRYTEEAAWAIVSKPPVRRLYQHRREWKRFRDQRLNWVRRVDRTPGGCWVWTGALRTRAGRDVQPVSPTYVVRVGDRKDNATSRRSPFWWMISEWFPHLEDDYKTETTCGNDLCVSPIHRVRHRPILGNARLTTDQVLAIYDLKGYRTGIAVADEYGVNRSTVYGIWRGTTWANLTGHCADNSTRGTLREQS